MASEPNAARVASATINMAAAAAKTANRTPPSSGSTVFVSQAYVPQAHHRTASRSAPRSSPSTVSLVARKPVTCVMAKTKTRSKNSSSWRDLLLALDRTNVHPPPCVPGTGSLGRSSSRPSLSLPTRRQIAIGRPYQKPGQWLVTDRASSMRVRARLGVTRRAGRSPRSQTITVPLSLSSPRWVPQRTRRKA